MQKLLNILPAVITITLCSCHKIVDHYKYEEPTPVPNCRVKSVTHEDDYGISIYTVIYNQNGLPEYVSEYVNDGMGYEFEDINVHEYDEQGRLIGEGPFSTPSPYVYRYAYEGNDRLPVRDTLYSVGQVYVEEFEYDKQNRIIRILKRVAFPSDVDDIVEPDEETKYYYDLRGNRQEHPSNATYRGLIEYSNKPSLYSLNRVWQLRYRNFSRNATASASTFNEHGLPVSYNLLGRQSFQPFLNLWNGAVVSYECE